MSQVLRHDGLLLHEVIEGRPTRRRLQVLQDLTKGDSYATLKRAAEERMGWK